MKNQAEELPSGWHRQKTGGRPRKDEKFIAINLARLWRINQLNEKAHMADEWIRSTWGVSDDANVRAICRRMSKGLTAPLRKKFIIQHPGWIIAASRVTGKGWFWCDGLQEAVPVQGFQLDLPPDAFGLTDFKEHD